jgi:hypothetical protein
LQRLKSLLWLASGLTHIAYMRDIYQETARPACATEKKKKKKKKNVETSNPGKSEVWSLAMHV